MVQVRREIANAQWPISTGMTKDQCLIFSVAASKSITSYHDLFNCNYFRVHWQMSNLSGLQKDVMSLYRRILREAIKKDRLEVGQWNLQESATSSGTSNSNLTHHELNHKSFLELRRRGSDLNSATTANSTIKLTTTAYAINEFRKQALSVNRSDFKKIDYMIRKGAKQIKLLRMSGVKLVSSTGSNISTNNNNSMNKQEQ